MIITALVNLIYSIFSLLTVLIDIPPLPDNVVNVINEYLGYLDTGLGILATYTDLSYLLTLFGIIIAVDIGILIYKFVMWVIRKIPMLGVE